MVRKRSRKYDSDNSDSDVDWDPSVETRGPAAKKYSLRERKSAQSFCEFDYLGLDEEEEARKISSEDDDFEVEAVVEPMRPYYEHSEPEESEEAQCSEGLIDFEDIIRADIVVNKNKIDYDNIIQKTEIKLTQTPKLESQPPKRRGRKPKNWALNELKTEVKDEIKEEDQDQDPDDYPLEPKTELTEPDESGVKEELSEEIENETSGVNDATLPNGDCIDIEENSKEIIKPSTTRKTKQQPVEEPTCSRVNTPVRRPDTIEAPENHSNNEMSTSDIKNKAPKAENRNDDDDVIVLDNADAAVIVLDD